VGEIEDADPGPDRAMLGGNPGLVLDRHIPATEGHHAGTGGEMAAVKGGL
jgi:hypothetical protein